MPHPPTVRHFFRFSVALVLAMAGLGVSTPTSAADPADLDLASTVNLARAPQSLAALGQLVIFALDDEDGREVWASDLTQGGTAQLKDVQPGSASGLPSTIDGIVTAGAYAYFVADDGVSGRELWRTDGTAAGTILVRDIEAGPGSADPEHFAAWQGKLFFRSGSDLWVSEGTAATTRKIGLVAFDGSPVPTELGVFFRVSSAGQPGLAITDGTTAGTSVLAQFGAQPQLFAERLSQAGSDSFYFQADGAAGSGSELWASDGTAQGTRMVVDFSPGSASSSFRAVGPAGNGFYFFNNAVGGVERNKIYRTDGTAAGTVAAVSPAFQSDQPRFRASAPDGVFYVGGGTDDELIFTDGEERKNYELGPGFRPAGISAGLVTQEHLYLYADPSDAAKVLHRINLQTRELEASSSGVHDFSSAPIRLGNKLVVGSSLVGESAGTLSTLQIGPADVSPTSRPEVTGTAAVGQLLSALTPGWADGVSFSYQWLRDGVELPGATQATYRLVAADHGKRISVRVRGSKPGFAAVTRESVASAQVVLGRLTSTPKPQIAGSPKVGQTLTARPGAWDVGVRLSFLWRTGNGPIAGANQRTFAVPRRLVGQRISVVVTGAKPGYVTARRTSNMVGPITRR